VDGSTIVLIVIASIVVITLIVFLFRKFPEGLAAIFELIGDIFSIF